MYSPGTGYPVNRRAPPQTRRSAPAAARRCPAPLFCPKRDESLVP